MSVATIPSETTAERSPRRISRLLVLILGVIVIPFALTAALNSYGALTVDGALRMAFGMVAGQTLAILSGFACVVLTIKRGSGAHAIVGFAVLAALITLGAVGHIGSAGDLLLTRLDLIAEVDRLNR
ncbi:hypothetical protein [Microbacterium sp. P05]|uniref:hypothetical protein n=1 Tax=Microbacterium sp. P05 TaxID=3366948 RepID=UPI003746905F